MNSSKALIRLGLLFENKIAFENQIFECSVAIHPNSKIDKEFKLQKDLINSILNKKSLPEEIIRSNKLCLSVKIFEKKALQLLVEIENEIQYTLDIPAEKQFKLEYLRDKISDINILTEKINLIFEEYYETDFSTDFQIVKKSAKLFSVITPPESFELIDDFLKWAIDELPVFKNVLITSNSDFINYRNIKQEFIYLGCLIKLYSQITNTCKLLLKNNQSLLSNINVIVKGNSTIELILPENSSIVKDKRKLAKKVSNCPNDFSELFKNQEHYNSIIDILSKQKFIRIEPIVWIDKKKGNKSLLSAILRDLKYKKYFKPEIEITNENFVMIAKKSFGISISIDTIKRSFPDKFDLKYIPNLSKPR